MNVHDDMTDNEVLSAAASSLSTIPMASPPDVEAIMARGRARRARRLSALAGVSVAGVAAGTALVLGLTGVLGPARDPGTIRTASFTLASNSNGTATLTISPKELLDAAALQRDLAQYGIPAKVMTGSLCVSDSAPAGFSQVVPDNQPGPGTSTPQAVPQPTITIDPAAMPAGTELSVGIFQLSSGEFSGEQQADVLLINTSSYTCSTTPPDPDGLPDGYGPSDGLGLLYGGPGPSGS
jgi:hypothetical protein